MFEMWTVSKIIALIILSGLSIMDYKIRKVPRDVLLICMAGSVIYQVVTKEVNWGLSAAGGFVGILFLMMSRLTQEAIGYGDSLAIMILGIYLGIWGLLEVLVTSFFILAVIALFFLAVRQKKKKVTFPFYPFLTAGYLFGVCVGGL